MSSELENSTVYMIGYVRGTWRYGADVSDMTLDELEVAIPTSPFNFIEIRFLQSPIQKIRGY